MEDPSRVGRTARNLLQDILRRIDVGKSRLQRIRADIQLTARNGMDVAAGEFDHFVHGAVGIVERDVVRLEGCSGAWAVGWLDIHQVEYGGRTLGRGG